MAKTRTTKSSTKNVHALKQPRAFDVPSTPAPDAQSVAAVQATTPPAAPATSATPVTSVTPATSGSPAPIVLPPTPSVLPDFISANTAVIQGMAQAGELTILSPAEKKLYAKMLVGGEPYIDSMAQIALGDPALVPGRVDPNLMLERVQSVADARKLELTLQQALAGVQDYMLQILSADWRDALIIYANAQRYAETDNDQNLTMALASMATFLGKGSRTRAKNKKAAAAAAGATGSTTAPASTSTPSSTTAPSSTTTPSTPSSTPASTPTSSPTSSPTSTSNPTPTANGGVAPSSTAPSVTGSGSVPVYTPSTKSS